MRLCVFCGSSKGSRAEYAELAARVGGLAASSGMAIVYGGGSVGPMGVLANAALSAGGEVIGVIPRSMISREPAHEGLTRLHVVEGMHARKALMARLADAFLALPGGAGTLDELFEVWTWRNLGLHGKPVALLDHAGFFEPLLRQLDRMVADGFVRKTDLDGLVRGDAAEPLLRRLQELMRTPSGVPPISSAPATTGTGRPRRARASRPARPAGGPRGRRTR